MGVLVDGNWTTQEPERGGSYRRESTTFRNWITPDGGPGPSGEGGFRAEPDRYHLYVSYACPWAHRTLIFRALKGLKDLIGVSVVHPDLLDDGWSFDPSFDGATGDVLHGQSFLRDVYLRADPGVSGRVTVPVLWDRRREMIVSNESAEIIRMFNSAFDGLTGDRQDFWPEALRDAIDPVNRRIYDTVNNGVYKAGFARSQEAYDDAVEALFETLDWLERRLATDRYLMGERITEADWRLFATLVRFDTVYHGHFKCNRRRLIDYPSLWAYTRELYQWPGVADTVRLDHITRHYHYSQKSVNASRIVPIGPQLDFNAPSRRKTGRAA